jgi:hypothetical protein
MNITPTVTPAPKPEWPEITAYIYSRSNTPTPVLTETAPHWMGSGYTHVATVTIPSSAVCEALAELERASEAVENHIDAGYSAKQMETYLGIWCKARAELRRVQAEQSGGAACK